MGKEVEYYTFQQLQYGGPVILECEENKNMKIELTDGNYVFSHQGRKLFKSDNFGRFKEKFEKRYGVGLSIVKRLHGTKWNRETGETYTDKYREPNHAFEREYSF